MSELKPGAFRLYDNEKKRYVETAGFYLSPSGDVVENIRDAFFDAALWPADPARYTVERWTKVYVDDKPVYVGDTAQDEKGNLWDVVESWSGVAVVMRGGSGLPHVFDKIKGCRIVGTIHDGREG